MSAADAVILVSNASTTGSASSGTSANDTRSSASGPQGVRGEELGTPPGRIIPSTAYYHPYRNRTTCTALRTTTHHPHRVRGSPHDPAAPTTGTLACKVTNSLSGR